ncbi:MAG: HAD-IB family hydrolase, partial [Coriobacteriales bacterium]|nr:HAD-IB family hydrolase [Coriobacteriales bacterium]
ASDRDNLEKLLAEMQDVPAKERSARFVCVMAYIDARGRKNVVQGVCEGHIATAPRGQGGFGYDPIFVPVEAADGRSMAELSAEEKNAISHRGRALKALRPILNRNVTSSGKPKVRIAAFDYDDTLLEGASPVLMTRRFVRRGIIPLHVGLKALWWAVRYKLRMRVEQKVVRQYIFASLSHLKAEEADTMMAEFYREELAELLRPAGLAVLEQRRSEGCSIVIVSASFQPLLAELARDLKADGYISTRIEQSDGYYTGHVDGQPPEGEQKLLQFNQWADDRYGAGAWELVWAYGDHHSDEPLLRTAENPVAVNPDSRLEKTAKAEGWPVVDWSR